VKNNLYNPLGYKLYKKYTFPDIFNQMLNITNKDTMIHPEMQIPHYSEFLENVLHHFDTMENLSADF